MRIFKTGDRPNKGNQRTKAILRWVTAQSKPKLPLKSLIDRKKETKPVFSRAKRSYTCGKKLRHLKNTLRCQFAVWLTCTMYVLISVCYRWCRYLQSRNLRLTRPLGMVGDDRRCAVDDPNGVLINIATPGWNEYEEEVNCPTPVPKGEGRVETACVLSVIVALVMPVLSLQL